MAIQILKENLFMTDAWLLVWGGKNNWPLYISQLIKNTPTASEKAHHILSHEVEGSRWSLLLVHFSQNECNAIVADLRKIWDYGFVNAVTSVD